MYKRIVTSVIGVPIMVALVLWGGLPLRLALAATVLIGMYEVFHAFSPRFLPIHAVGYVFAVIYIASLETFTTAGSVLLLVILFLLVNLVVLVLTHKKTTILDVLVAIYGFFYVPILLSCVYMVRILPTGKHAVWLIFIAAWGCDTGAYWAGKTLGKHKLIATLSPNKTVEGAIGGVLFAGLLGFLYVYVLSFFDKNVENLFFVYPFIAAVGAILAQFGDLSASAIKRYKNIKDFGNIIPGHGGVIDRFDSVLFTAPLVYSLLIWIHEYLNLR